MTVILDLNGFQKIIDAYPTEIIRYPNPLKKLYPEFKQENEEVKFIEDDILEFRNSGRLGQYIVYTVINK
jgi:hypothetical protein